MVKTTVFSASREHEESFVLFPRQGRWLRGGRGGGVGGHASPPTPLTFLHSEKKKERQSEKERVSKQKLLKGCHQGQNVIVLTIIERLEFSILPDLQGKHLVFCY